VGVYDMLEVRTVINAVGPVTRLSGNVLHPEVTAAMAEAARHCVRIEDLQEAAGHFLADVTGAEAGYVTAGAASGLALGAAACIAGLDVAAMDRLPETNGLRNEIVIQRSHLTAYTHALRLSGARLVEVGYLGYPGQGITWPWQIEAAITEHTAALAFTYGIGPGAASLAEVVAIAHRHNLPVIVDAAAALPPAENLRALIAAGADLVAFSGGKAIGGPQASGILVGRADLIASVALQHQDMDVYPETWTWRDRYLANGELPGPPHHGIGRPMKVGKEEIVGLVVALKRFLARDHDAERAAQQRQLEAILAALDGLPGVRTELMTERAAPSAVVRLDEAVIGQSVEGVINALIDGEPAVAVGQNYLHERGIGLSATVLQPGEEQIVAARLRALLTARC
jgi:D-glucosaminate-6-phosphate ammonia-lyase